MGSLTFRFKKPINYAYAPGLTKAGKDGGEGNPGADGNAVYFIDYELNNSYIIELTQQKLENNYMLSGESELISDKRGYHTGDIIISNQGNCYRIVKGTDSYYTYGIEYLGRISGKDVNEAPKFVTEVLVYEFRTQDYPNEQQGFMPSNRQFLVRDEDNPDIISVDPNYTAESDVYDSDEAFKLNGVWYKFVVVTDSSFGEDTIFTVELALNNKKTYQADSVSNPPGGENDVQDPTDLPLYQIMKFNKNMEFKAASICEDEELLISDVAEYGDIRPVYISDMSLDKMHLFNNDIKSPVFRPDENTYCSRDGATELGLVTENEAQLMMRTRTMPVADSRWKYAVYSTFLPEDYMSTNEEMINWRGGESAFFSSCSPDLVIKLMRKFLDNESTIRVIVNNDRTGEITVFDNVRIRKIEIRDTEPEPEEPEPAEPRNPEVMYERV